MRLFNAVINKWIEPTEYTKKAWEEGRRPHLFDHEPTREELIKSVDLMRGVLGHNNIYIPPMEDFVKPEVSDNKQEDGDNWVDVTSFDQLPEEVFKTIDEICEGEAESWGFDESILEYALCCSDSNGEEIINDYYEYTRTVKEESGHVIEVHSSAFIKDINCVCEEELHSTRLYTKESYEKEYSRDNVVSKMEGEITFDSSYKKDDILSIVVELMKEFDIDHETEIVHGSDGHVTINYEKKK